MKFDLKSMSKGCTTKYVVVISRWGNKTLFILKMPLLEELRGGSP